MGRGIKAGKKKEAGISKGTIKLMEESYSKGYQDGIHSSVDKAYRLIVGLALVSLVKEFGFSPDDTEKLNSFMDELSIKLENREICIEELRQYLISKGVMFRNFIEEDEIMKKKYNDVDLIKGIEKGLADDEILEQLSVPMGSSTRIRKRLTNLRKSHGALEINIKEPISEANGINYGKAKTAELVEQNRVDVESIMAGIENKNKALKGESVECLFQGKPAVPNLEFEAAVQDMVTVKNISDKTVDDVVADIDEDIDPAYKFDQVPEKSGTVKVPCEMFTTVFQRQAELAFRDDMDTYSYKVSELTEKLNSGEIINLADIVEYNKIAEKYRGVYGHEATDAAM